MTRMGHGAISIYQLQTKAGLRDFEASGVVGFDPLGDRPSACLEPFRDEKNARNSRRSLLNSEASEHRWREPKETVPNQNGSKWDILLEKKNKKMTEQLFLLKPYLVKNQRPICGNSCFQVAMWTWNLLWLRISHAWIPRAPKPTSLAHPAPDRESLSPCRWLGLGPSTCRFVCPFCLPGFTHWSVSSGQQTLTEVRLGMDGVPFCFWMLHSCTLLLKTSRIGLKINVHIHEPNIVAKGYGFATWKNGPNMAQHRPL